MLSLTARRPLNNWNYDSIRPGVVGSVGDANVNVTFKSTFPGDYREAPYTKGDKESQYGSNVRDGDVDSPMTGAQGARVEDGFFGGMRDSQTTQRGWQFQNIKPEDMMHEPIVGELAQYKWKNQVSTILNAVTGKNARQFSNLPGGYKPNPGSVSRGGNVPGIVSSEGNRQIDYTSGMDSPLALGATRTQTSPWGESQERIGPRGSPMVRRQRQEGPGGRVSYR